LLRSEHPEPHTALETANTSTPPSVLSSSTTVSVKRRRENIFSKRIASTDLRIGLNLLGENGRILLREYSKTSTAHFTQEGEL